MRKIRLITPIVATAALVLLTAGPALADSGDTGATFTIIGGAVVITAPVGPVSLNSAMAPSLSPQTAGPTPLGAITVNDGRGDTVNWNTTVIATPFTVTGTPARTVAANAVTYAPGSASSTGTVTVTPVDSVTDLTSAVQVVAATGVSGINSGSWSPNLSVAVPAGALVGLYASTVTHSAT
jgi:hypothetical protein